MLIGGYPVEPQQMIQGRADIDQGWVKDGRLTGFDPGPYTKKMDRSFSGQRGLHYPQPPEAGKEQMVGFPQ